MSTRPPPGRDLTERLLDRSHDGHASKFADFALQEEAATEIERLEKQIETMAREHDAYYAELTAKLFDAVNAQTAAESKSRTIEAETREACAKFIEAECERILSKQSNLKDIFAITVDHNLRLMAAVLPDLATAIRAAGKDTA